MTSSVAMAGVSSFCSSSSRAASFIAGPRLPSYRHSAARVCSLTQKTALADSTLVVGVSSPLLVQKDENSISVQAVVEALVADTGAEEEKSAKDDALKLKLESDLLKKKQKRAELRRKRLVRKRHMRKKGRWPPSKMAKLKNV